MVMELREIKELHKNARYRYETIEEIIFEVEGMNVGKWDLYAAENGTIGRLIAKGRGNKVEVKSGFKWDGCAIIGNFYENEITLRGSLLHDLLYVVAKNNNFKATFNLFQADIWFRKYMLKEYKYRSIIPWLYYFGVTFLGLPWKFGKNRGWLISDKVLD